MKRAVGVPHLTDLQRGNPASGDLAAAANRVRTR